MDFLDKINEKTIIVCPSTIKRKILNEINKRNCLINVKIYSLEELKRIVYFDYDIDAILYLMDKHGYSYDIANYYIKNIYYVEDKKYDNEKLDKLVDLKQELYDNNLLSYNKMFIKSYKNTKFLVVGYDYIDYFSKKILSSFNYEIISEESLNRINDVYKFNTLEEEILFVIDEIILLINKGISLNNIYLLNLDSNYIDEVIRLFNMFNIPIDLNNSSSIISTIVGNNIYNKLVELKSIEETVKYMDTLNMEQSIYDRILKIFNKYYDLDYSFDSILKCVKYDFENTEFNKKEYSNSVKIGDLYNSIYEDDDYVFLLGFNQGSIPKVYKDEDYISDDLKRILDLDSTDKLNKERIKATTKNINRIKNITITYKEHYLKEVFYPSNLLNEDGFVLKEKKELSTDNSSIYSKLKLAKMLDNLINYDEKDKDLPKYYHSIKIDYLNYDNKYQKINKSSLHDYINNTKSKYLSLSYTSIDEYFKCHFKFYITRILQLNKYEDSFELFLGSMFHDVLSKINNKDFDYEKEYDNYLKNNDYIKSKKEYTSEELFYIDKLKKELKTVCDFLSQFHSVTKLSKIETEKPEKVDKSKEDVKVIFNGKIDKIMSCKDIDKDLVAVIDYKTGNDEIKLSYASEGIGLQLLIYLYFISKDTDYNNPHFVGFYLQNILKNIDKKPDKTYMSQLLDSLRLNGYTTDNLDYVAMFDPTYNCSNSKYIKSMGFKDEKEIKKSAKLIDSIKVDKIIDFIDKKIDEARDGVLDAEFKINPKMYFGEDESISCQYCKYKDICFMKDIDYERKSKNKAFDFLEEGDIDD